MWLASFKQHSAVHGKVGKSATSAGLRAPAGRFDAARGGGLDNSDGRRVGPKFRKKKREIRGLTNRGGGGKEEEEEEKKEENKEKEEKREKGGRCLRP